MKIRTDSRCRSYHLCTIPDMPRPLLSAIMLSVPDHPQVNIQASGFTRRSGCMNSYPYIHTHTFITVRNSYLCTHHNISHPDPQYRKNAGLRRFLFSAIRGLAGQIFHAYHGLADSRNKENRNGNTAFDEDIQTVVCHGVGQR